MSDPQINCHAAFIYVRRGNGTREIADDLEIERHVAGRWGRTAG